MDKSEREIRLRLKADFLHYAEKCLTLRAKSGALLPFTLNAAQLYLHDCLEQQLKTEGKVRALIVKGRQQGCSTYAQGRFYWKVTHKRGVRAFILTHLEEASRNLFGITKRFHESCPAPVRAHAGRANARELLFDRLDSGYRVGTARASGTGRSDTLQYFHGSEVAYWRNAREHMSGILQAVPDAPGTEIILESTSAGADGLFHQLCQDARRGRSDFRLLFVPWFWQPEYRRPPPQGFTLTSEERDCKEMFALDDAQIFWRRMKIYETGNIWTFRREYPATVDEAFQADRPGALWTRELLHRSRREPGELPEMQRIVVAIDPAATSRMDSDETGIIVAGLGDDGHAYILDDLSGRLTPAEWAARAIAAFHDWKADKIVAESNQGGEMVTHTLRTVEPNAPVKLVHASRGKHARAEPVAALDTQGRVHHAGIFPVLEDQMCRFTGARSPTEGSPDRVDARVWAITELLLTKPRGDGPQIWN